MRIFKLKVFARFQRGEGMQDETLCRAVQDAEAGLVDADLGGGIIKQRVARQGQGKRGGYRTVIAFRSKRRAVFLFGFAKNAKSDLTPKEQEALTKIGARWLGATDTEIEAAIVADELKEVYYVEKTKTKG